MHGDADSFGQPVSTAMVTALETLAPDASLDALRAVFARDRVAIVEDAGRFVGLITRIDLLNHLRKRLEE